MVDSKYSLSLDSIDSKEELSNSKFKKVKFIKKNYYDELVPYFFKDLPAEIAFHIKFEDDVDKMSNDFSFQYDEIYQYGARNITNNKNYTEEFEYFAPLYIQPGNLPKNFIIFRVDGPGIINVKSNNFKSSILRNFKTVKVFDLSKNTALGEWLDINFNNNKFFPLSPLEVFFQSLEFTKWNGIDYETGGYTSKSTFLETVYEEEREIFEFEKLIFDGYKENKIVFPNILNLSFLFDDTPATDEFLRKWSINRYYGFYLDEMEKVKTMSPYITPFLKSDVIITSSNYLYSKSGDPFVEGYFDYKVYYIEYLGEYYEVKKVTETGQRVIQSNRRGNVVTQEFRNTEIVRYKIIADIDLQGKQGLINQNFGEINSEKKLIKYDQTNFQIEDWDKADVWIIEIDGVYHNLFKDSDGSIKVNSDYTFEFRENEFSYWINKPDPTYTKIVSTIVDKLNSPKKFTIYKLKFTDICDFDDRVVDTEYSKFEYEKEKELTYTDETKMYLPNLKSNSNPKDLDDFVFNGEVVNIPVSSEYTANYETFKISDGELSEIWRKNPVSCRWIYQNSLSSNDYPYLLNNSLIFEDFNRTVNPFDPNPSRIERNLDYFYTINSSTFSYIHHSLHIEDFNTDGSLNTNYEFELDKYLNLGTYSLGTQSATYSFDYFTYFFERKTLFNSGLISKNVKKYSLFNKGDKSIPNSTLFRGIKFNIFDVEDVNPSSLKKDNAGQIADLNLRNSNTFENYKFSIILTDNEQSVIKDSLTSSVNTMTWKILDNWQMDKVYDIGDLVIIDDIIYMSTASNNITTNPIVDYSNTRFAKSAPYNQANWTPYTFSTLNSCIFYSPAQIYPDDAVDYSLTSAGIVYNYNDYYYYNSSGVYDFWNPVLADGIGYSYGELVIFKGKHYMSMTSSNHLRPDYIRAFKTGTDYAYFWVATQSSNPLWIPIQLWNPSQYYPSLSGATYVVHEDVVYKTRQDSAIPYGSETGNVPGISGDWDDVYSLKPFTDENYTESFNPIIEMNDSYYLLTSNTTNSTLECGINIYINKKWKNILININISDNTTLNISNSDRDSLYNELNKKLTAFNFINCINDISNKYSFTDYVKYIIIEEDGTFKSYDYDNIEGLPYLILCEDPDEITIKRNSLNWTPIDLPKSIKPTKFSLIIEDNLINLNDYNEIPVAASIINTDDSTIVNRVYHGGTNILEDIIYRYSGFYMPLFYEIQLFEKNYFTSSVGNYRFDTSLSEFGLAKERKIRKINKNGSVLKLEDSKDEKSIYPMLDEFGYTFVDFFIFKSSWDNEYYYSTFTNQIDGSVPSSTSLSGLPNIITENAKKMVGQLNSGYNRGLAKTRRGWITSGGGNGIRRGWITSGGGNGII